MLTTLYGRIALVLTVVFLAVGALMIAATQQMLEVEHLVELATALIIGTVAFSLGAALIVFKLLTERLSTLAEAMEAFRVGSLKTADALPRGNPRGDEVDRLGHAFREMSERIIDQFRELQAADETRRELLANVSHDLRTPLTSMQGYLEMLLIHEGRLSPEEHHSYLQVATRHCVRLGRLVDDLFELTKLEGRETRLQREDFPLQELAQDVAQKFALRAANRNIRIDTGFDPDSPPVRADLALIERLLDNLMENALRHTPAGGHIHIHQGPSGDAVEIRVQDSGEGIPAAQIAHVFDRYYQVDRGESGAAGAAGLGLAIARRIVELHAGEIAVESVVGEGTCVVVRLPAAARRPGAAGSCDIGRTRA